MKNNKIWYLGYVIGICSLILVFTLKLNEAVKIALIFCFWYLCIGFSCKVMHQKILEKDYDYKISVNDERNEKIRDKTNAMMAFILMLLIE